MVWKGFPAFPAHLRMRPVSRGNSRRATWVGPQAERVGFKVNVRCNVGLINFVRRFAAESLGFIERVGKRGHTDADFVFTGVRRNGGVDRFF